MTKMMRAVNNFTMKIDIYDCVFVFMAHLTFYFSPADALVSKAGVMLPHFYETFMVLVFDESDSK